MYQKPNKQTNKVTYTYTHTQTAHKQDNTQLFILNRVVWGLLLSNVLSIGFSAKKSR